MRTLVYLSALALVSACSDSGILEPAADATLSPVVALAPQEGVNGAMEFTGTLTLNQTVNMGDLRVTPSGVWHGTGLVNEFVMEGDLEGFWYFQGKYQVNTSNGKGRSIANPALVVVTGSTWGLTGSFECNFSAKIEAFGAAQLQYGNMTGCPGTGDFEGMKMNGRFAQRPGETVFDFRGVIW